MNVVILWFLCCCIEIIFYLSQKNMYWACSNSMIQATKKDAEKLYNIILDCSSWLQDKGVNQWSKPYPKELFLKDIEDGHVFYFLDNNEIIGTATLHTAKPYYYPSDLWNDEFKSWYLCRFAVPRSLKNKGFGRIIVSEIKKEAKNFKINRIRLDAVKSNSFLEKYYLKLGFCKVAEGVLFDSPSVFMEMMVEI